MKAEGKRKKEEGANLRTRTKEFALRIIQQSGSARGCLAHLRADKTVSDEQSRRGAIEGKRQQAK